MRFFPLVALIGLPLVVCLPQSIPANSAALERRGTDTANAQFNMKPYLLSDACLDCTRPNATALFSCSIKCKCRLRTSGWLHG